MAEVNANVVRQWDICRPILSSLGEDQLPLKALTMELPFRLEIMFCKVFLSAIAAITILAADVD